ncbi:HD domain-containing protein [bacterium]|nr:HD domain-containing protein [bacterium]
MFQTMDQVYYEVPLNSIRIDSEPYFNIYNKIEDEYKFFHSKGEPFTDENLDGFLSKGIMSVFIHANDSKYYSQYLADNLTDILGNPNMTVNEKAQFSHAGITGVARILFEQPKLEIIRLFKSSISSVTDFVLEDEDAISELIRLTSYSFSLSTHSVNVGIFALGLAKMLLGNDPFHNMREIAAGFFLHDIGKSMIPQSVLHKAGPLTHNEWRSLKLHPTEGYKLLNQFKICNNDIKTIVMQHHERNNGRGYPYGLHEDEIHLYSKICSIADVFEALTSHRPYKKESKSSFSALLILRKEMAKEFDPHMFQQFVLLFRNAYDIQS